jgi:hypothetical protein
MDRAQGSATLAFLKTAGERDMDSGALSLYLDNRLGLRKALDNDQEFRRHRF